MTPTAGGAQVSYALTPLPPANFLVTNTLIFQDSQGISLTNTWTWMLAYSYLRATNSLPPGSLTVRGFDIRMVQTDNAGVNLDNSLNRAEQQLAIPPLIPFERTGTSIVQVLDFNETGTPNNVPGLCPGAYNNFATEVFAYLELTAGLHRFHIQSDDDAAVYAGTNLKDSTSVVLHDAGFTSRDATFDFVVEAAGFYPFRIVWEETGGNSVLALRSVNLSDNSEVLINDPANPGGVVKAWYPLACMSAMAVTGPYAVEPSAVNEVSLVDIMCSDTGQPINQMVSGGTFTIPQPSATRFYKLDGPRATRVTEISRSGSNIIIRYQVQ